MSEIDDQRSWPASATPGEGSSGEPAAVDGLPSGAAAEDEASRPADAPAMPATPATPATPVASALRELDTLTDHELAEHPDVYQRIHRELQAALATIDDA